LILSHSHIYQSSVSPNCPIRSFSRFVTIVQASLTAFNKFSHRRGHATTAAETRSIQTLPGQRRRAVRVLLLLERRVRKRWNTRSRIYFCGSHPSFIILFQQALHRSFCLTIIPQHIRTYLPRSLRGLRHGGRLSKRHWSLFSQEGGDTGNR
jgi:hypothetical protein